MVFDSLTLAAVCDELARTLVNGKIERITQPTPLELVLRVYAGAGKQDLYLSCEPAGARLHLTSLRRENPPRPYAFCMLLRKYLDGGRIVGISRPMGPLERVVAFECQAYDGAPLALVAEIMGRHSNLILVNSPGVILGAAKHITSDINRYREILPGIRYRNPPRQREKLDPLQPYSEEAPDPSSGDAPLETASDDGQGEIPASDGPSELSTDEGAAWLLATFAGVSPILSREAALRAEPPLTRVSYWTSLHAIFEDAQRGRFEPVIWSDDSGATRGAYPIPLLSVPAKNQYPRPSINAAIDSATSSMETRDAFDRLKTGLLVALQRSRRHKEREADEIQAGLRNSERADEYQQSGDLIQTNQHAIPKGAAEITVDDYYAHSEDGKQAKRTIALDTTLGARDNAARYYKKAKKARESVTALLERAERVEREIGILQVAEAEIQSALKAEEIETIHERVASLLIGRQAVSEGDGPEEQAGPRFEGHKIKTFRSVDGWEILVGENATSNDYLTTKLASPTDIWLHVRAATSAHGIIRAQNRPGSVSPAAITYAAELVAARSEVKHSSLIPVDYTLKKYVRKPRKSAPGSVTYQNEKTVYVNGING